MTDVSGLVKDWVYDILNPDIEWSEIHEQLGEYIDGWDELSDGLRDQLATEVDQRIQAWLVDARSELAKLGKL